MATNIVGYFINAEYCRPTFRNRFTPGARLDYVGFRLILPLQSVG